MPARRTRKSLVDFLIDTGIRPFALLGQSVRFFGAVHVAVFLLGVAFTVGYSRIESAPYRDWIFAMPQMAPQMEIRGAVKDWQGRPLNDADVYIAAQSLKPVIEEDGRFSQKVPVGNYQVIVIDPNDRSKHGIANVSPENLPIDVPVPPGVGRLKGTVRDKDGKPQSDKLVWLFGGPLVSDLCTKTDSEGGYVFESVGAFSEGWSHLHVKTGNTEKTIDEIVPYRTNSVDISTKDSDPLVTGTVRDVRGRPLPNLRVAIVSADGRRRFSSITAYDGTYSISVPTRGAYTMEVWLGRTVLRTQNLPLNEDHVRQDVQVQ